MGLPVSDILEVGDEAGRVEILDSEDRVCIIHSTGYTFLDFWVASLFDTSSIVRVQEEEKYIVFGLQSVSRISVSHVPK